MRRAIKSLVLAGAVALACAPAQARAEGYISPWAGGNFGNDQVQEKMTFGANAGWMGAGIIGGELSFGWAPNFFGDIDDTNPIDNSVLDLMGNLIVGIPVGGTRGIGFRPYVTGGLGMIRTSFDTPVSGVSINNNDFGYNLGAGAMGFFNDHFGLRGEVKYLRTIDSNDVNDLNFDLGGFHFWRATAGIVIR